jgi:hypothetical protein
LTSAAPFGTNFFVSLWFGEKTGYIKALLARIPFIGKYLAQAASVKTYSQIDTENMFVELPHIFQSALKFCPKIRACQYPDLEIFRARLKLPGLAPLNFAATGKFLILAYL